MSSQTFLPPSYAGSISSGAGDPLGVIVDLAERQSPAVWIPIALAVFSLLALTVVVTNTGEDFAFEE